jgi:hypothetical protein
MNRYLALLLACCISPCFAGSTSFVVAAAKDQSPVAASLEIAAEYVAVPISISSTEKDPLRNLENVQTLTAKLLETARKSPNIKVRQGSVSLSVAPGDGGGFLSSKSYPSSGVSASANLYLVAPLTSGRDLFQVAREITSFAQSIVATDSTRIYFGATSLGIDSPERFRSELLVLIKKDIEQVRSGLGNPKSFEVSGLEAAISVIQRDDKNLILYIPYKLKVGQ